MAAGAGTIGAGPISRVPRWGIRVIMVIAAMIAGVVAVASAISFTADEPTA
jgi:hypothetical protein